MKNTFVIGIIVGFATGAAVVAAFTDIDLLSQKMNRTVEVVDPLHLKHRDGGVLVLPAGTRIRADSQYRELITAQIELHIPVHSLESHVKEADGDASYWYK